jgi:hypothetical protein
MMTKISNLVVYRVQETAGLGELMAEIDTRPLESVQAAVSIFDRGGEQSRLSPDRNVRAYLDIHGVNLPLNPLYIFSQLPSSDLTLPNQSHVGVKRRRKRSPS